MKSNKKNFCFAIGILLILLFLATSVTFLPQEHAKNNLSDEIINSEPVKVVKRFWELSENGDFEEAKKLRTNTYGEYSFKIDGNPKVEEREVMIYKLGFSLVSVEQVDIISDHECEIAVKVKDKNGRKFYLFHTVVKNGDEWKIFATTR